MMTKDISTAIYKRVVFQRQRRMALTDDGQKLLVDAGLRAIEAMTDDISFVLFKGSAARRRFMAESGFNR